MSFWGKFGTIFTDDLNIRLVASASISDHITILGANGKTSKVTLLGQLLRITCADPVRLGSDTLRMCRFHLMKLIKKRTALIP